MGGASSPPPPAGLAGIAGADAELPAGAISRGDDLAALAAVAPARSVHQAISCRPEDVRKPSRSNSVHRGFTPGADGSMHHGGSHHSYMALKIQKLGEQNEAARASGASGVFTGVSIYVNGITDPPWIDLKDIMLSNGGRFQNYYSRATVTHIVCAHLTAQKLEALAKADRHHPPVVRPEWVVDSLREGKLMPCARYALQGTLEPGQRRVTAVLARVQTRVVVDDDGNSPTCSAPSSDPSTEEIAPTQEELEDTGATRTVAESAMHSSLHSSSRIAEPAAAELAAVEAAPDARVSWATRVVFETTRARLETTTTSTAGRDSRRFASEEAIRVAAASSAAAYGALAAVVDPTRVVPVSAWEALVKDANEDANEDANVDENSAAIAGALVAAGVDATATRVRVALPVDGVARVVVPTLERHETNMTTPRTTTTLAPSAPLSAPPPPSALKSAGRSRGSSRGAFGSSAKRKRVVWSEGVEDGESPARADDGTREGGTGADDGGAPTATGFGPGRRSSFAAAAARAASAGVRVDDATWAELPLDVRAELMGAGGKPARGSERRDGLSRGVGSSAPGRGILAFAKRRRSLPPDPTRGESEAPDSEAPGSEAPGSEAPGSEAPGSEAPGSEAPGPGSGSGSAASAFARHLGMRREAEADEGRLRRAGEMADDVSRAGEMAEDVSRAELDSDPDPEPGPGPSEPGASEPGASDPDADGGFPSTYSQIDPDVLEAIGEDERRRLRAHYDEEARRSREAPTRRGVVVRKTANARARGRAAEANRLARMFSAKPHRDGAPAGRVTRANLDHLDHHLEDDDEDDGARDGFARDAYDAGASTTARPSYASTTARVDGDDVVDGLVAALETCVESLAGNDAVRSDANAAALGAAADLLEDQGVAFAEARALEWTARLMRRAASLATTFPERWRVHFERAWRGVAAAVAREYDGATLSLEVRDGNPRGEGKITVGPKVGGWFS